jgi:sigma-E factor negative regulatory protein RseB
MQAGSMQKRIWALAMTVLWAAAASAGSSEEARAWIKRMNDALLSRSYDGVLTHRWVGGGEALRIIHRVQGGRMVERVMSTDGSGHEEIRNGTQWIRYLPDRRIALVQTRNRSFGYIATLNGLSTDSDKHYHITHGGVQSLFGWPGPTQYVAVEPRDGLRYGYRFWLDQKTAMPIKTQLVAKGGEVIDEIAFSSLRLVDDIPDALLRPAMDVRGYHAMRIDARAESVTQTFAPQASLLPVGFRVLKLDAVAGEQASSGPQSRFIVSDGITWVSVFVEPAVKARAEGPATPMGASESYVRKLGQHYITVVGDVPAASVKVIAEAFRPE